MRLATRHMIDRVTYWTFTEGATPTDPFAAGSWSAPTTLQCEYETGGKVQRDQNGEEFTPMSVYWCVAAIPYGAFVVLGASAAAEPPANAEKVRKVGGGTSLRGQMPEFVAYTG